MFDSFSSNLYDPIFLQCQHFEWFNEEYAWKLEPYHYSRMVINFWWNICRASTYVQVISFQMKIHKNKYHASSYHFRSIECQSWKSLKTNMNLHVWTCFLPDHHFFCLCRRNSPFCGSESFFFGEIQKCINIGLDYYHLLGFIIIKIRFYVYS